MAKKTEVKKEVHTKNSVKLLRPNVYLGTYSGGVIPKQKFDDLLKNGFTSYDSDRNKYSIAGFDFTYAEHVLYEDEGGNLQVLVDYLNEYCPGDTISANISLTLYQRIKAGDTIFIDNIKLHSLPGNTLLSAGDTSIIAGKAMKCVISK